MFYRFDLDHLHFYIQRLQIFVRFIVLLVIYTFIVV